MIFDNCLMLSPVKLYLSLSDLSTELLFQLSLILKEYLVESHLEHKTDSDTVVCSIIRQGLN